LYYTKYIAQNFVFPQPECIIQNLTAWILYNHRRNAVHQGQFSTRFVLYKHFVFLKLCILYHYNTKSHFVFLKFCIIYHYNTKSHFVFLKFCIIQIVMKFCIIQKIVLYKIHRPKFCISTTMVIWQSGDVAIIGRSSYPHGEHRNLLRLHHRLR